MPHKRKGGRTWRGRVEGGLSGNPRVKRPEAGSSRKQFQPRDSQPVVPGPAAQRHLERVRSAGCEPESQVLQVVLMHAPASEPLLQEN